jgi:hypothetical protein
VGKYLVDFNAQFAALFSGEIPKNDVHRVGKMTIEEKQEYFVRVQLRVQRENAEFTSGFSNQQGDLIIRLGMKYPENKLNWISKTSQLNGCNLIAGERLDAARRPSLSTANQ